MTNWKALIAARPKGDTTAQLVAAYGNPIGPHTVEHGDGTFDPDPAFRAQLVQVPTSSLPGFPMYQGSKPVRVVTCHRLVEPVLIATFEELARRGLSGKMRSFDGSYNPRHMGNDPHRPVSTHSFGVAFDFDAAWNRYGSDHMEMNADVVRCLEECGWTWGGRWDGPVKDGMHFQWTNPLWHTTRALWQDAMVRAADVPGTNASKPGPLPGRPVAQTPAKLPWPENWLPVRNAGTGNLTGKVVSIVKSGADFKAYEVPADRLDKYLTGGK